jgi:oxygen-independent coproporphyrinogen-3 oxidase
MAGIYIHIPFCKQACHYCDFHFSTSLKKQDALVAALMQEMGLRQHELAGQEVQTIYFGGGTPSLLTHEQLAQIIDKIKATFLVSPEAEVTLEANPDDINPAALKRWQEVKINRLSVGVQSFVDAHLTLMNRSHNSRQALNALGQACDYFQNISIDLIYGIPGSTQQQWISAVQTAINLAVPHISGYALTVEPSTAYDKLIRSGQLHQPDEEQTREQFDVLIDQLLAHGFAHYELSNFGKPGFFSRNNIGYWQGSSYLGIGPSAHSYNGEVRSWNIANNSIYINQINSGIIPATSELLTKENRYNEMVMTGLRTMWGISVEKLIKAFGVDYYTYLLEQAKKPISLGLLELSEGTIRTTPKGKFLADGLASELFM